MENYTVLLNENLDILKEIGSIGMGHASTSLAQMLNMKVAMTTPVVYIMSPSEAVEYLEKRGETTYSVMVSLQGDAKGAILQMLSKKFAMRIINYYFQNNLDELGDLDEMGFSVIQEIGNITSGAYCNSLASMTGLFMDISTPVHCNDFEEDLGLKGKDKPMIIINNSFFMDNEEVNSDFLFMPDEKTTESVLVKLKEYYGFTS
ncbi:MAG: chemotaxis protein CheC [Oscillospiraceae bacterium]|nr:chemotaxis protein CheC [Oscillospiraceae bacterium]